MSKIEWTDKTWNPIVGCSIVSPGCTNCYAMRQASRLHDHSGSHYEGTTKRVNGNAVWTGKVALAPESILLAPLKRKKPTTWFVNSMGDVFHESVKDEWIDRIFAVMALCPQHKFQVLTKRAKRMREYFSDPAWFGRATILVPDLVPSSLWNGNVYEAKRALSHHVPLLHVYLGVSAEDQANADERIPDLLATPAEVRFVSLEPLLGAIELRAGWIQGSANALKRSLSDASLDNKEGQYCGKELGHVSGSVDFPDADRLPPMPFDAGSAPPNLASDVGQKPVHQFRRSAIDSELSAGRASGTLPPLQVPLSIEDARKVSQDRPFSGNDDSLVGERRPATAQADAVGRENPRNRRPGRAETIGELVQTFAGNVSGRDRVGVMEHGASNSTISWVIVGGESGPHARPMHPDWVRSIRDQCQAAGVAFFFKQWGHWALFADGDGNPDQRFAKRNDWMLVGPDGVPEAPDYRWPSKRDGECAMLPVGKKAAGRLLDGIEHNEMPR